MCCICDEIEQVPEEDNRMFLEEVFEQEQLHRAHQASRRVLTYPFLRRNLSRRGIVAPVMMFAVLLGHFAESL